MAEALVAAGYSPVSEDPLVMDAEDLEQAAAERTAEKVSLEASLLELEAILADDLATDEEKQAAETEITAIEEQLAAFNSELTLLTAYLQAHQQVAALVNDPGKPVHCAGAAAK